MNGKRPKYGGRQKVEIDFDEAERVAALGPNQRVFANYFKLTVKTIAKRIKERYKISLHDYLEQRRAPLQCKLIASAIDIAINQKNVTMIIFLLKNYCGFSDKKEFKQEITSEGGNQSQVAIVLPEQLKSKMESIKKVQLDLPPAQESV